MKRILLLLLLFILNTIDAQEKMMTTNGIINFEASIPLFEPVEAKNERLNCILNTKKGTISFMTFIKQFRFKRELMEEHFKATFKGIIEKFDLKDLEISSKNYYIRGKITIHGKSKTIRVAAKIKKDPKGLELITNFTLNTDDFNIEVPFIVRSKISKKVTVTVYSIFQ
jgi:hypothetical protein